MHIKQWQVIFRMWDHSHWFNSLAGTPVQYNVIQCNSPATNTTLTSLQCSADTERCCFNSGTLLVVLFWITIYWEVFPSHTVYKCCLPFAVGMAAAACFYIKLLYKHKFRFRHNEGWFFSRCGAVAVFANGVAWLEICTHLVKRSFKFSATVQFKCSHYRTLPQHIIKCSWHSHISMFYVEQCQKRG